MSWHDAASTLSVRLLQFQYCSKPYMWAFFLSFSLCLPIPVFSRNVKNTVNSNSSVHTDAYMDAYGHRFTVQRNGPTSHSLNSIETLFDRDVNYLA